MHAGEEEKGDNHCSSGGKGKKRILNCKAATTQEEFVQKKVYDERRGCGGQEKREDWEENKAPQLCNEVRGK